MEQQIKEKINSATSMKEAEQFAEKLTYEISYEHKRDSWRTRYEYLNQKDFEKLGWKVFCIGAKDKKSIGVWLIRNGFVKHDCYHPIYYSNVSKELFMIDEYGSGTSVSIENSYRGEPNNLFTLDEYKSLLVDKLIQLYNARLIVEGFINSLIAEHKYYLAQEENEILKQQIIEQALEKAREQKLIL